MSQPRPSIEFPDYYRPFFKPARYKGLYGGRGSGKSHSFAGHLVLEMARNPDVRAVCIREVQRSIADSVRQLLEDKIDAFGLREWFAESTDQELRCASGAKCIFRGMQNHTAASIKSLEGVNRAWVEEAQTLSQRSIDLLLPTIRTPGSEIWFSWNPDSDRDPVDKLLREEPPAGAIVREVNYWDNAWFPDELRADMDRDRRRDYAKYCHVWEGAYRGQSEARVFTDWEIGRREPPARAVWFYGADWGFAEDPTVALRCCFIDERTIYIDAEAYGKGTAIEALPALLMEVPGFADWPSRADSARPETIDYCRRHGLPKMRPSKKGKGSVEHGVSFLQGFRIIVSPDCPGVADELRKYAYRTDKRTGEVLPVLEDKNNHFMDALRYAVERVHKGGKLAKDATILPEPPRPKDYIGLSREDGASDWKTL